MNTNNRIQIISFVLLALTMGTSFADISFQEVAGPFKDSEAYGASWGNYNNDRCPDLHVNHHRQQARIYKNLCNGSFKDATTKVDVGSAWLGGNAITDHHGSAWGDFDNDGDQDLFATTGARFDGEFLVNEGGVFRERASQYGLSQDKEGRLPLWVDYDNDGDLDLFIQTRTQNFSTRNDLAQKKFVNSGKQTGNKINLVDAGSSTNFGLLIDLNDDGNLEYLGGPEGTFPTAAFDMTQIPFIDILSKITPVTLVSDAAIGDFNNDLQNDILLLRGRLRPVQAKQFGTNRVEGWLSSGASNPNKAFRFKSPGGNLDINLNSHLGLVRFHIGQNGYHPSEEIRAGSETKYRMTLNADETRNQGLKSYNPNELTDKGLYIGYDTATQEWVFEIASGGIHTTAYLSIKSTENVSNVVATGLSGTDKPQSPVILKNTGDGFSGSNQPLVPMGDLGDLSDKVSCVSAAAADFDNDMDIDIYLVCTGGVDNTPNRLYKNRGNGKFDKVNNAGGAMGPIGSNIADKVGTGDSVVTADYNGDGKMDMFVTNGMHLFPVRFRVPDQLYKNNTSNNNRWIEIDLEGTASNRDAVGAKVYATAGGKIQLREQNGGTHRWSQHHKRIHFGLGSNQSVNLRIEWPSGFVDTFNNVSSNKLYNIKEGGEITQVTHGPVTPDSTVVSPKFSINDLTVYEGDGEVNLTVTLSKVLDTSASITYSTQDALSARAGSDFTAKSAVLTFNAGETVKTVTINLINSQEEEEIEYFNVNLSRGVNADINDGTGRVKILDGANPDGGTGGGTGGGNNSGDSILSAIDTSVNENIVGQAQVVVTLNPASTKTVSVDYATKKGTALAGGTDYKWRGGTLTFTAGQTSKTISVPITDDNKVEPDETFKLRLSNANNAIIGKVDGIITILDDDSSTGGTGSGSVSGLSVADVTVNENIAGQAQVVVSLNPASTKIVSVDYVTKKGTALGGRTDYKWRGGTLTFNPGDTSKTISISITDDTKAEPDETFKLRLSNANNATIGDNEGIITIIDDDGSAGGGSTGGSSDQISISRSIYYTADKKIWVKATSTARPIGSIEISVTAITNGVRKGLGQLQRKSGKSFYQKVFKNLSVKPDSIELKSSAGGISTATVTQQ